MTSVRLPVSLNEEQRSSVTRLAEKYVKSQAEILRVGLKLLEEQERAGFDIPQLKNKK